METWRFRPRLIATVATAAFCAVTIAAGFWQLDRANQKFDRQRALHAAQSAPHIDLNRDSLGNAPTPWQPVRARGEFLPADTVYLDNRIHQGRPGYHVITPFRIFDSRRIILVNRGWMPLGLVRHEPPIVPTDPATGFIEGLLAPPPERTFELGTFDPSARVWPNLTIERFTLNRGIPVEPFVLLQTSDARDGLVRVSALPAIGAEKNQSYALQWFSFAALALVLYIALNLRSNVNEQP
jgi:surfeit locus 1 family protein